MNNKRRLSEYKRAVLTTITMRLSRQEALAYLRGEGYPISNATLGRIKSELNLSIVILSNYEDGIRI